MIFSKPLGSLFSSAASRAAFFSGVRDTFVVIPSYLPFGLVCGIAAVNAGLTTGASLAMPALVFGGSAQAVVLQFVQSNASLWIAVLSGCVVNLRFAVYSAAISARVKHLGKPQRMLVAAFLVDHSFVFLQTRERTHPSDKHLISYYAGTSTMFWTFWFLFCGVGVFAGNIVPASWQIDFAIPLSFIAVAAPAIRNLPMAAAALVGGIASILLFALPLKLGLIAACLAGLMVGLLVQKMVTSKS